jgi:twitching motility protein PilT
MLNLEDLLEQTVRALASDLHISPGQPPIIRVDGELLPLDASLILTPDHTKSLIESSMSPLQKKDLAEKLEIDFAYALSDIARFRVNAFYQMNGLGGVFRVIPAEIPSLEELGMPDSFKKLLELPNGLILVTGPTGSGKSTTLAAMIDHINKTQACHIITIEDPIEFVHHSKKSLINQREVGRDTRDFAAALHSALREDPDVILVGEMRDLETIRLALTAAETGHLVLASLHTSSAPRSISRIIDVFPTGEKNIIRNMLSESLQAVICETLVRRIAGGRVAALEVMMGTPAIRNLIREDKIAQMYSTMQMSSNVGMCTLDQYLQGLVAKNIIDYAIARDATSNKELFSTSE